ncbi:MAG: cbb3-type cytochrome c oxidase subunit II [Planctomycetaceae bacterium]|nr:cbb3-type cytochrome c oxidase subunit II [Planctomycetaceae bacterium]
MKMTPALLIVGGLLVFWSAVFVMVILPISTMSEAPSDIWRPWTQEEQEGNDLWVNNGCHYCHSQFIRVNDWGLGAERIAQAGDYANKRVVILGTERIGPDLSQAGGEHSNDWHIAHFNNPRWTRPISLMPSWAFLGESDVRKLTAFIQSQGGKDADQRMRRQMTYRPQAQAAYRRGFDANVEWLHAQVPPPWRAMPNPYPASEAALLRGHKIFQDNCLGCHGPIGDGQGPAAAHLDPPPLNFTILRKHLIDGRYIGGLFYYQIMNGVTGTSMPYFKRDLESEKIWDVSNYLAVYFVGYTDANMEPRGIDASYEPSDPKVPTTQGSQSCPYCTPGQ